MLLEWKKKTIMLDEIKKEFKTYEHTKLVILINELISEGEIEPIKSSDKTPNYPQIHKKYRIKVKDEEVSGDLLMELNKLYYTLSNKFYKQNIKLYKRDREYIQKLNKYLINQQYKLNTMLSANERSYEIFTDEKFLVSKEGKEILSNLGVDIESFFNIYFTPEPFCYISLNDKTPQKILIVENKDTYVTLMKLINSRAKKILNTDITTIIYGEGYKIVSSFEYIHEDITINYLSNSNNEILYWGDIDREGFKIYETFKNKYPLLNIKLFSNAYEEMINKSKDIILTEIKNKQKENYKEVLDELDEGLKIVICEMIDNGNYIPQEILNIHSLV